MASNWSCLDVTPAYSLQTALYVLLYTANLNATITKNVFTFLCHLFSLRIILIFKTLFIYLFLVKVNTKFAIKLVAEEPVRDVETRVVSCDGGGGALGHPKVYINLVRTSTPEMFQVVKYHVVGGECRFN